MLDTNLLRVELTRDEGMAREVPGRPGRLFPYRDSKGIETIGVGRNLQEKGISLDECDLMLSNDIEEHLALLDKYLPWWRNIDDVRQRVVANMAFNLGVGPSEEHPEGKLLTFRSTLGLIQSGDYDAAADHMQATPWAQQVGARATRLIQMMRTGQAA